MKRIFVSLVRLCLLTVAARCAQAQYLTISGSTLSDASGNLLSNATIFWTPVLSTGQPVSFRKGAAGGQVTVVAVSANIANGAFSLPIVDTAITSPANVCYQVTVTNNLTGQIILQYPCVQPASSGAQAASWCTSSTCNFDAYTPTGTPGVQVSSGPPGSPGPPGPAGSLTSGTGPGPGFVQLGAGDPTLLPATGSNSYRIVGPAAVTNPFDVYLIPGSLPSGTQFLGCAVSAPNVISCNWSNGPGGFNGGTITTPLTITQSSGVPGLTLTNAATGLSASLCAQGNGVSPWCFFANGTSAVQQTGFGLLGASGIEPFSVRADPPGTGSSPTPGHTWIGLPTVGVLGWTNQAQYPDHAIDPDTGLSRYSPGLLLLGNGVFGDQSGSLHLKYIHMGYPNSTGFEAGPVAGAPSSYLDFDFKGTHADGTRLGCVGGDANSGDPNLYCDVPTISGNAGHVVFRQGGSAAANIVFETGWVTAPTGSCVGSAWIFSEDGHLTFCNGTTWVTKI